MPFTKEFYQKTWINGYMFAQLIIPALNDLFPISSVIDIGCGSGGFLKWCYENMALIIQGIEIDDNAFLCPQVPMEYLQILDTSIPIQLDRKYDVCVSLEVAEHIPEGKADILIDNLVSVADKIIIFSAARPGQAGEGHINCQPQKYWIEKFCSKKFYPLIGWSNLLRGNVDIATFYRENCIIFIKK
jgi:SAM-dependent methyltransferase